MVLSKVKKNIAKAINSSCLVEGEHFLQLKQGLTWFRMCGEVVQMFSMEKMASENIRLRAFVFSIDNKKINAGGNVTRASVQGGDDYGADWYWDIRDDNEVQKSISDIKLVISRVLLPWFNLVNSLDSLNSIRSTYPNSCLYEIGDDFDLLIDNEKVKLKSPLALDMKGFRSFLEKDYNNFFAEHGFERIDGERVSFVRQREEIYDVFIFDLINYGLAVGVYAFNWVRQMSLDGSGHYSEEFAFLLNGGVMNEIGELGVDSGVGFGFSPAYKESLTQQNLKEILSLKVIPRLSEVSSLDSFKASINRNMYPMARHFGF